ncbi:chromo domain-containing protein [Paenibacillus jiagnxiensis]|uniref:hypothetical protein n=1 Tax=Paenibacillus jiagnxiensis TaxID=3228926 RepID=UPI0033BBE290
MKIKKATGALADKLTVFKFTSGSKSLPSIIGILPMYLHQDLALQKRKTKSSPSIPSWPAKFREACPDFNKTDRLDAWVTADRLHFGCLMIYIVM